MLQTVATVATVATVVGVDPHKRVLSAVALDGRGGRLGQWQGGATRRGVEELWSCVGLMAQAQT